MTYHVVFAADENYAGPLKVAVYSYSKQHRETSRIYVLHSFLSKETSQTLERIAGFFKNELVLIKVDDTRFANVRSHIDYISIATFYRYLIAELLPDVSQALYLDSDILVNRALNPLLDLSLQDCYAAGVLDRCIQNQENGGYLKRVGMGALQKCYINAGVLFFNLDMIRENNLQEVFFQNDAKLANITRYQDQDVLNYSFNGKVHLLEKMFNWMAYERDRHPLLARFQNPYIVHYTGARKPWKDGKLQYWDRRYVDEMKQCEALVDSIT